MIHNVHSTVTATPSTAQEVTLFVVKFDYDPFKMSPNPNPQQELSLTAGRYVYIYGDMDEVMFLHIPKNLLFKIVY